MTNFFLYCIKTMSFSGSPKGTPHDWCRRTMKKKLFCNENQWNWVVILKKMINIFTGDLYSMYVVLQGIGSLPCIIPCRTTYIEYRSPVNIFINFLRITTQFHWFSLQNSFFFIVLQSSTTPVVGGTLR